MTSADSLIRSFTWTANGCSGSGRLSVCPVSIGCCGWRTRPVAMTPRSEGGLTEELICSVKQPMLALFGEYSPFLATADYLQEHLPNCVKRCVSGAKHRAPEENATEFVEIVYEYLTSLQVAQAAGDAMAQVGGQAR